MYSIKTFCQRFGLSEGMYFSLQRQGRSPIVTCVGKRRLITPEDAEAWLKLQPKRAPLKVAA